jgi:hypothetical protein
VEGVGVVRACQQTVSEGAVLHTAHVPYAAKPKP